MYIVHMTDRSLETCCSKLSRFSYAAATLWNAISDDGLKNSEHVEDFYRKGL